MKKALLLSFSFALFVAFGFSQTGKYWTANLENRSAIIKNKAVARLTFPTEFKLYHLDLASIKQQLYKVVDNSVSHTTVISLPNADGGFEDFEIVESSNFDPALQARFPQIRAFSGKGISDRTATLKLSYSPKGIQTMLFRNNGKPNEFIETYSADGNTYAVFKSNRKIGQLPWTCSTPEADMANEITAKVVSSNFTSSSDGKLRTMRLAQSCNAEYSNWFGAFSAADVALVLAGFNATLTRCNGVYEKDFALHLNLIPNTDLVIYYNPSTDPYTTMGNWNNQLQAALTANIGEANYDIGHMFGASGGGGNAGCIGCVCVNGQKGRGITSPADGIPQGDNFDIDYVAHEVGHQLGANHTFSMSNEGTGVNKEVGSGITVMGYAGITGQDVAPHSIDIFHQASIQQVSVNLAGKACPIVTDITANNATPVVAPVSNITIPISTPFALTGSATDANAADVLTYCWEQNDNSTTTGNASVASPTKLTGPNWLSFLPTTNSTRLFPRLSTILNGASITPFFPGGDPIANIEALSSVSRTLNFRLTVRDNSAYSSTAPIKVGQTAYTDMVVTVSNTVGPFLITTQNAAVSYAAGSTQTLSWSVNGTTGAPTNTADVKISWSTDQGQTFTTLIASTPNDGTENIVIPSVVTSQARVKVEAIANVYFDINNANITVTAPPTGFSFTAPGPTSITCAAATPATVTLGTVSNGGFNTPINLTATNGVPAGTTVSFTPTPVIPGNSTVVTLNNANTLSPGTYDITVTGVAGANNQTQIVSFIVLPGSGPAITGQPIDQTVCSGSNAIFSATSSGTYQWQVSTNGGTTWSNIGGATSSSYTVNGATMAENNNEYQVIVTGQCGSTTSFSATLTVNPPTDITNQPTNSVVCEGSAATFTASATGTNLGYQWQVSTDGGTSWSNIAGETSSTYTIPNVTNGMNNNQYHVVVSGNCAPTSVTSSAGTLIVGNPSSITDQPDNITVCEGLTANFSATATGSSLTYQWQVSTDGGTTWTDVAGATSSDLSLSGVTPAMSGYQYRLQVFSCTPTPIITTEAVLTVNTNAAISAQPNAVTLCSGNESSFSVTASGTGIGYQWQYAATCGGTFTNIAGATSADYTISNTQVANGGAYQVVITGTCNTITSSCVDLVVNTPVAVSVQPADASVCLPTTTTSLSITASGTAVTYQWQVSSDGGTTWTNVSGATSATLNLTGLAASDNGKKYRVQLSGTCTSSLTSDVATLAVNSPVEINAQPVNVNGCTGESQSFSVTATGSTITYQWQVSVNGGPFVNITGATSSTLTLNDLGLSQDGNMYQVIVSGVPCGAVTSQPAMLTVNIKPGATLAVSSHQAITPYTPSGLFVTVSPEIGPYSYEWYKDGDLVAGWNGASIPVNTDNFGNYQVTVTNTLTGCSNTTNLVQLTPRTAPQSMLFIYPNPTKGKFSVRHYSSTATTRSVVVYASNGARVWAKEYATQGIYESMDVDISGAAAGVYHVVVRDKNGKRLATGRVMKR